MSITKKLIALGTTAVFATPALAGGPGPVIVEPAPVAVAQPVALAADWTGFYGGLSYSKTMGDRLTTGGVSTDFNDGSAPGAMVGYNWQHGNMVFGGELAYHSFSNTDLVGFPGTKLKDAVDLKARLGYAAGRAMPYLTVGYSMSKLDDGGTSHDLNGASYGVGVDFLATDNIFIGAEYLKRDLSGSGYDAKPSTFGIRVGYLF